MCQHRPHCKTRRSVFRAEQRYLMGIVTRWILRLLVAFALPVGAMAAAADKAVAPSPSGPRAAANVAALASQLDEAKALLDRRSNPQALKILTPLLPAAEAARHDGLLFDVLFQSARGHYQMSDYRTALPLLERALHVARAQRNREFEANSLRALGQLHKQQGAYPESIRISGQAVAIYDELGNDEGAGRSWMTIGAARDLMGEFLPALDAYAQARKRLEKKKDTQYFTLLNEVAITYTNLGRYEDALAALTESLEGRRRIGDPYLIGISYSNLGDVYLSLGQHARAIEYYEPALEFCRQGGDRRCPVIVLGQLSQAWLARGDYRRALEYGEQELESAREIAAEHLEGVALGNVAEAHRQLGDTDESLTHYEQALALARRADATLDQAAILKALSEIHLSRGEVAQARAVGEQALALAQKTHSPDIDWQARVAIARAARAGRNNALALTHLHAGVDLIESVRGRVRTDSGKIGYLDSRQAVFYELADALHDAGDAAQSLEIAEAVRGRAFSDLLAARELTLQTNAAASLAAIREAETRLRGQQQAQSDDETVRAQLATTRAAAETELHERLRALQRDEPELASLVAADPIGFHEIASTAARLDATLVEYLVTDKRLLMWVVQPGGRVVSAATSIDRATLRGRVRALHERINHFDAKEVRNPAGIKAQLAELYRTLVAPIAGELPADPASLVYFVPHDVLLLVPFAALVDEKGRYLVQSHTLASTPSVGVLRYTAVKKQNVISAQQPRLLALADPRLPQDSGLEALPGARTEVRKLGAGFPAERRLELVWEQASEANAKRLSSGQTLLHFAVHGLVSDDRPWESALLLAPGAGEDGWLKVNEIFGLDLHADLVVLSGCSTGLGKLTGDGFVGLARALIYAGTPSVIVSQWDVSDLATAYLMERFYANLTRGRGKAQSLRAAQLAALNRFPAPALWAAFTLIGEPK